MTTSPIAMVVVKAITFHDGHNQCHYHEAPKRLQNKPLEQDKEGRGN
jgi:hypothetical protein